MRILVSSIAALVAAATFTAIAGADPASTPVTTGCPAGYSLFSIYRPHYGVPAQLDSLANGGNGDQEVCAHQLPEAVVAAYCNNHEPRACTLLQLGLPLYQFREDNSPAQGAGDAVLDFGS